MEELTKKTQEEKVSSCGSGYPLFLMSCVIIVALMLVYLLSIFVPVGYTWAKSIQTKARTAVQYP